MTAREKRLVWRVWKKFEGTAEQSSNAQGRKTGMPIVTGKTMGRSSRPRQTPFNPFIVEEGVMLIAASPRSSPLKERPTSPIGMSSSGTQCNTRVLGGATIAEAKEFVKEVRSNPNIKRAT